MEHDAGSSSPVLQRSALSLDVEEELELHGEVPLLEERPAVQTTTFVRAPSPQFAAPLPPPPAVPPPTWPPPYLRETSKKYLRKRRRNLKGPLRALRLCFLALLLPAMLVAGPLYIRYHVYADQVYPLAMSDMRILDGRVSTTWCQRQVVSTNATYNAFLLPEQPQVAPQTRTVAMERDLRLADDMKEYWAFYLLRGSSITVSACVSSPGASLVVIRGHKHLHDCAYIGDNSSEEADEDEDVEAGAFEAAADAARRQVEVARRRGGDASGEAGSNEPAVVRRAGPGVQLLGAQSPLGSQEILAYAHAHDPEPDDALRILNKVAQKRAGLGRRRGGGSTEFQRTAEPNPDPEQGKSVRPQTSARTGSAAPSVGSNSGAMPSSSEVFEEVLRKLRALGHRGNDVLRKLNIQLDHTSDAKQAAAATNAATARAPPSILPEPSSEPPVSTVGDSSKPNGISSIFNGSNIADVINIPNVSNALDLSNGPGVTTILDASNVSQTAESPVSADASAAAAAIDSNSAADTDISENSSTDGDILTDVLGQPGALDALKDLVRQLLKEHAKEAATAFPPPVGRHRRASPPPLPGPAAIHFHAPLVDDPQSAESWSADEEDNVAMEVDFEPDGIADHHVRLNETEAGDLDSSNSEFWSSFSSSEEALLSCRGLVLNLPLHPHHKCTPDAGPDHMRTASSRNTLTYRVPSNGYYFFVFGSENEVQTNYIRAHFHLERVVYNVSSPVASCQNTTEKCALPLDFFSSEKLVLEVPVRPNSSLWNEEFLIESSCEPRTALYVACIIAVPVLILMFAFQ